MRADPAEADCTPREGFLDEAAANNFVLSLVWRNLVPPAQSPALRRTLLSIFVAFVLFALLMTDSERLHLEDSRSGAASNRLMLMHKVSIVQMLRCPNLKQIQTTPPGCRSPLTRPGSAARTRSGEPVRRHGHRS